jgi:hypothetical protein
MRDLTSTVRRDATRARDDARRRATGDDGRRRERRTANANAATRRRQGLSRARDRDGDAERATAADARGRGRKVTHRERVADAKDRRAAVERED